MDILTSLTLADLFTLPGIAASAAIVYLVVQIAKANFPALDARVSGALQATVIVGILYLAATIATPGVPIFTAFLFWLVATAGALGIHSAVDHIQDVQAGTAGTEG